MDKHKRPGKFRCRKFLNKSKFSLNIGFLYNPGLFYYN